VPSNYSDSFELGQWVRTQRYNRLKISKERVSKLDSIGFTWDRISDVQLEYNARWEIMYEEFRKFKDRVGHCQVPKRFSDNPKLGKWVSRQRSQRSKILKELAAKLDSIGFTLETTQDARWEIMLEELRKFKYREGHCNVPSNYSDNFELGQWVRTQRCKRLKISKERASKLDSIGFTWDRISDVQLEYNAKWEIMYEELRKFKDRVGHCNVPSSYSDNPKLGRWVRRQRSQRSKVLKERASKLDLIGFSWVVTIELNV